VSYFQNIVASAPSDNQFLQYKRRYVVKLVANPFTFLILKPKGESGGYNQGYSL
jgi:hypothetical protein